MKTFLANLRGVAVAGFFSLLPIYVLLTVMNKAWASLSSMATSLAKLFGLQSALGGGGSTVLTVLLLVAVWITCGLLVRISFVGALDKEVERQVSRFIPGYTTYKAKAEEKLHKGVKILPYASALVRQHDCWQPGFVVEQDGDGNSVVFLPSAPNTNVGSVLLAKRDQVRSCLP